MRVCIESNGNLVLRDGRPFGSVGDFGGNSLLWPQPQTLAGMVRTKIGLRRDARYFEKKENVDKIMQVRIRQILASLKDKETIEHLSPVPADLLLMEGEDGPSYRRLSYAGTVGKGGTDISNPDWIIPRLESKAKPSKERPYWLRWSALEQYIQGETPESQASGIQAPLVQEQFHNAIDRHRFTTEESKLFLNRAIYLRAKDNKTGKSTRDLEEDVYELLIHLEIDGLSSDDAPLGEAYLGGDRKTVQIVPAKKPYPECPNIFEKQKFLKLLLMTHGDFGGWCPEWLMPDLEAQEIAWVQIPDTDYKVRLRTAVLNGWDGISGWDYAQRRPKAMRKLLRPGSVFLLELKDPAESQKIAEHFWGNTLSWDKRGEGYGQVVPAKERID